MSMFRFGEFVLLLSGEAKLGRLGEDKDNLISKIQVRAEMRRSSSKSPRLFSLQSSSNESRIH